MPLSISQSNSKATVACSSWQTTAVYFRAMRVQLISVSGMLKIFCSSSKEKPQRQNIEYDVSAPAYWLNDGCANANILNPDNTTSFHTSNKPHLLLFRED